MNVPATTTVQLPESLQPHVEAARRYFDARQAENTRQSYDAGWRIFEAFCRDHGLTALPADPQTVATFATELAQTRKVSTIRARLAAVSAIHRNAGAVDPTKSDVVRGVVSGIAREHGTRPRQARGLTEADVARIQAAASDSLRDRRDVAMLLVARDLLARRSEVAALEVGDVEFGEQDGTVIIRRSKTDQEGEGATGYLGQETVAALRAYMVAAGITDGPLFRALTKGGRLRGGLSAKDVARAFKRLADVAGLDSRKVSGHSARVGMAQDLARFGASVTELQNAGRWADTKMPARYSERQAARRSVVARFHESR
jgi:integrase